MRPRLVVGGLLNGLGCGDGLTLPDAAVRHVQVLRMQPGETVWVLDGRGAGWVASIEEMGRKHATVRLQEALVRQVELPVRVSLLVGVPANDRMDALVEKATELGAWSVQPVLCERAVWRADGARADKKVAHWQGVAQAAAEQSGRMVVPTVHAVQSLAGALVAWSTPGVDAAGGAVQVSTGSAEGACPSDGVACEAAPHAWFVLDPRAGRAWGAVLQERLQQPLQADEHWGVISGPEGGLTEAEVEACVKAGATPVALGPRILRADTAPLAMLASLSAMLER